MMCARFFILFGLSLFGLLKGKISRSVSILLLNNSMLLVSRFPWIIIVYITRNMGHFAPARLCGYSVDN